MHHSAKQELLSQQLATLSVLLTNVEYIVPIIPLVEFKHKPAVRMDFNTDHMEQSPLETTHNRSGSQIRPTLWKYVDITAPCVPTLSQMNPFCTILPYFYTCKTF